MPHDAYELIAQTARYIFAALMLLIVLRAARITLVDSRRAAKLRRLSPSTGIVGEMVVLEGDERAKRGMRYPTIREGTIGSSRSADIRIRHSSVRRRHAYFQMTENGLHVRGHAGARLRAADGTLVRELTLADGANFGVGRIHLLLVLSEATASEEIVLVPKNREPDPFDVEPDGYRGNPTLMNPRPDAVRRDEFRRIRREVRENPVQPHPRREPAAGIPRPHPTDPFDDPRRTSEPSPGISRRTSDDPFGGVSRARNSHPPISFDEPRRPSGSTVSEGIRRNPTEIDPDRLFDTDDDTF